MTPVAATMPPPTVPADRSAAGDALRPRRGGTKAQEAASPRRGEDRFTPSSEASRRGGATAGIATRDAPKPDAAEASSEAKGEEGAGDPTAPRDTTGEPLTKEEQEQVEDLRARDREVRQHEQAHKAAAGQYATSGPTYSFQQGPDGRRYAVGGEVGIDTSEAQTPEATIRKMQQVRRAALAPAEPSAQDRRVAAAASQKATAARAELAEQRRAERAGEEDQAAQGTEASAAETGIDVGEVPQPDADTTGEPGIEAASVSGTATLKGRSPAGALVDVMA